MSWKCDVCLRYNPDSSWPDCTHDDCGSRPENRTSNRWWKCKYGHYNYENQPYCSGCSESQDDAVATGHG